jgi:hypothetical protein
MSDRIRARIASRFRTRVGATMTAQESIPHAIIADRVRQGTTITDRIRSTSTITRRSR